MTVGEEKTTVPPKMVLKRECKKMVIVGLIFLYLFLDPRIFANGFPKWGIIVLFAIVFGVSVGYELIMLSLVGIHQEVRVKK